MTRFAIIGPYGDGQPWEVRAKNVARAEEVARNLTAQGHQVMCAFLMTHYWLPDNRLSREHFLPLSRSILEHWAEAVVRIPGDSPGTDEEEARAYELGLPVIGAMRKS